jgi:hypothetical protein
MALSTWRRNSGSTVMVDYHVDDPSLPPLGIPESFKRHNFRFFKARRTLTAFALH